MEKILKAALIVLCVFGLFAVAFAADGGKNVIRKPAAEIYLHPETGLVFTPRVSTFEKTMVRVNPLPEVGTTVSYEDDEGALADVYLYQTPEPFREHAQKTLARVLSTPMQCTIIQSIRELPGTELRDDYFAAKFKIQAEDEQLTSHLVIFIKKDHLVKIRITYSEKSDQEDKAAEQFIQSLVTRNTQHENHITTGVDND